MREILQSTAGAQLRTAISLNALMCDICATYMLTAKRTDTMLINVIPGELCINWDLAVIRPVLAEVFGAVVSNARNGLIHVSAERFRDTIYLQIQERNTQNGYALASSLKALEPLAALVEGYLAVKGQQSLVTTITFSFPVAAPGPSYLC